MINHQLSIRRDMFVDNMMINYHFFRKILKMRHENVAGKTNQMWWFISAYHHVPHENCHKKRWIYASFWLLIHRNCGTFQELFEVDLATKSAGGRMMWKRGKMWFNDWKLRSCGNMVGRIWWLTNISQPTWEYYGDIMRYGVYIYILYIHRERERCKQ